MPTAQLVDINPNIASSCNPTGGISYSWLVEAKYISAITIASGILTNFTMTSTGNWKKYTYDRDATANYNQTPNRNGKRRTYTQVAFMKFGVIDSTTTIAANDAILTCDVVAIHVLVSGTRQVQGLEEDAATTGGFQLTKVQQTLLMAGQNTDVSTAEARTEFTLQGEANTLSLTTSLSDTAILAL
ncbi:MAG: hypothetical protein KDC70_01180 [Saprospiraceae bacterium]|nr:hypothetical protein [Saprospiraceae bacterium]